MSEIFEQELLPLQSELLPWSEKYRPSQMSEIVYHDKIIRIMNNYLKNDDLPHILFYGISGTGKTSTIISFAKEYYGENFDDMVLVLNSSEERGINTVRNKICQFVITNGTKQQKYKLVVLDEIDEMTVDAQSILRKIIERYIKSVRFCFICNYLKKISPAIQSRCVIFRFNPIPYNYICKYVNKICVNENIDMSDKAMELIIEKSGGDMRKLLNIIQSLWMYKNNINSKIIHTINQTIEPIIKNNKITICEEYVSKLLSCITTLKILEILQYIQNNNLTKSCTYVTNIINNDISLNEVIMSIYNILIEHIITNNNMIKYSNEKISKIIQNLSVISNNLSYCNNQDIQIYSFISVFYL